MGAEIKDRIQSDIIDKFATKGRLPRKKEDLDALNRLREFYYKGTADRLDDPEFAKNIKADLDAVKRVLAENDVRSLNASEKEAVRRVQAQAAKATVHTAPGDPASSTPNVVASAAVAAKAPEAVKASAANGNVAKDFVGKPLLSGVTGTAIGAGLGLCGGPLAPITVPGGAVIGGSIGGACSLLSAASKHLSPVGKEVATAGTMVAGAAAIGAGLGLCGGPFAPITVPGGAAVGAVVGGALYGVKKLRDWVTS